MIDRSHQMLIFHAVCTQGSLTKAAEILSVSVSHISKQLKKLEDELGVQLLNRNTRKWSLTQEGEDYARFCHQMTQLIRSADEAMYRSQNALQGQIRIAMSHSFGKLHILPALRALQKQHPELNVEVTLCDHNVDMLTESIDLWFTTHEHINEGYVAQRIADSHFVVAASPDYLAEHGVPHHPAELAQHNCITYHSRERSYLDWLFKREGEKQQVTISGNYRVDLAEAVKDAVIDGEGIGYIATYLLKDEFKDGQLVQVLTDWEACQNMPLYAVYPRKQHLPARISLIIDHVKQHIGQPAYWDKHLSHSIK